MSAIVARSHETQPPTSACRGQTQVIERQDGVRSCGDVLDVHQARRDALWVEPAKQVSPVAVGEEVPDLHRRKLHPGGGVMLD